MEPHSDILILGIGNVLLTDEGVGVRVVNELQRRYRFSPGVEIMDGGTAGIELLRYLGNRTHLIIIDAMAGGRKPGTVTRVEGDAVPAIFKTRISPHQLGLSDLLASAMLTGEMPENLVMFGIEPANLDTGIDLSEPVEAIMGSLLEAICNELTALGVTILPLPGDFSGKARFWEATHNRQDVPPGGIY
ncbi:MAG: HyaD/HybD family hydrogenase maturation endopeptidase [Proteobacteria bacterium]|nr:HyaD/HybD family hydrogenase maturation endopeptidase [Pseudomonadota bacterium]MBU1688742.1 HyaD/HybD family hydrogenase maturation endopeptidase [Pseudomonadota bacterium]